MSNDNVSKLSVVNSGIPAHTDEEGFLANIASFIKDHEILEEWDDTDIELSAPQTDEVRIAELTYLERKLFVIAQLLKQLLRDEMVEMQAKDADRISHIMREKKLTINDAVKECMHEQSGSDKMTDFKEYLGKIATVGAAAQYMFEWTIRCRTDNWSQNIIVRSGFVAYSYG